ncbi:Kinesin-like protein KIP2 [Pseudozyma hubeiensis]|nr:Kinesin-like protein KIP2 [Pseudozyma hubeiensis]
MFRFRSSTSSPSSPLCTPRKTSHSGLASSASTSSELSTASSVPSSASSNSVLSLLQAHSSVSASSSLASALSPATSFASLPSEPFLTAEPCPTALPSAHTSEPKKAAASPARPSTSSRNRKTSLITSPRTSKATTTITARPSISSASRRSTISPATTEHRSSNTATMAKKAKVGSAAKSSPFTKLAATEKAATDSTTAINDAESSLASVAEDEVAASSVDAIRPTVKAAETSASSSSDSKQNVVVCVRMRPSRSSDSDPSVWSCDSLKSQITPTEHHPAIAKRTTSSERAGAVPTTHSLPSSHDLASSEDPSSSTYHFQFDKLITGSQTTDDMYHSHIAPVVRAAMEGYNGTVFAYGQTGSGKTHTMSGSDSEPGVIPRAVEQVFQMIKDEPDREYLLRVSYLEIYNETLKDLLAPLPTLAGSSGATLQTTDRPALPIKGGASGSSSTLRIIEDQKSSRVIITGLREEIVTDSETVLSLIQRGQDERHVGATDWNERSSRSHCVFQLTIESRSRTLTEGKEVRISQLNLIDLAGSERAASQAERRKEGAFINKSLLTLGTVIGKLTEPSETGTGDAHIPYRDSKLTRILQTSLSGNARIAVICTLSPDMEHANETLSTLKFGKRCKLVVTTAKKGMERDDKALLQKYRKELDALRAKLEANGTSPILGAGSIEVSRESQQKLDELNQQKEAAKKEVEDMQKKRTDLKGQIEHLTKLILTSQSVASDDAAAAGPSTPLRKSAHASALARRGPRMSDFGGSAFNSPIATGPLLSTDSTLSGAKPFELEAELAALRRQLRQQIESRTTLIAAHTAELAARDARQAELQDAIKLNEEELDEAEVAYDKLKAERDEARSIALKEQDKARENRKKLLEEQEANRLLKLVAKARAGEEDKALQAQIEKLRAELSAKEEEAEQVKRRLEEELKEARRLVAEEQAARAKTEEEMGEVKEAKQALQVELDQAMASVTDLKEKHSSPPNDDDDDDVNTEFQNLVRRASQPRIDLTAELKLRESELQDREAQLERLRTELEQTRLELSAKPDATRELASLRDELGQSEEERQTLQIELAKLRATAAGREQDSQRVTLLEGELSRANDKIAELEKEVVAEKEKATEAMKKVVVRPLPVPLGTQGGSVPNSPIKALAGGGSKLRPGATTPLSSRGLNRAGSVKEYRRYQAGTDTSSPTPPSPTPASGSRSVILGHTSTFSSPASRNALLTTTSSTTAALSNKAEREEIDRLNAVIASQRAIMSDLEKSVASWKERMKTQAELIHKLVLQNSNSPPASDGEAEEAVATTPRKKLVFAPLAPEAQHSLPRTTHLSLSQHPDAPYYGAHTFNRPPATSPVKPLSNNFTSNTWSSSSPHPLPLPGSIDSSPSKRKPRKTIEMDLKLLNSSPRVESSKNRFSIDDRAPDTPTRRRTNASAYYI